MEAAPAFVRQLGRVARSVGQSLDKLGVSMQEGMGYAEKLVPSTRVVAFKTKELQHGVDAFVASTASVVGDVQFAERASAWYGATVRGDSAPVKLGRNTSVMDNALVSTVKGKPATIGADVTICSGAVVQSATIGDGTMIGMGAVVLPGASIGSDCFIDAGAVVPSGTTIPSGQLWTGAPAKFLRNLSSDEMSYLRSTAVTTSSLGLEHAGQQSKDVPSVEYEEEIRMLKLEGGFAPNIPVSHQDADVIEYYKLTSRDESSGLFRDKEFDLGSELAAREAEELAADKAEEAYFYALARAKRVGEAVRLVAAANRPSAAAKAVADLEARDPEGAEMLRGLVARVAATSSLAAGSPEKEDVLRSIDQLATGGMQTEEERKTTVAGLYDALAAHSKAGMGFLGPAAGTAGAAEAKMA